MLNHLHQGLILACAVFIYNPNPNPNLVPDLYLLIVFIYLVFLLLE